MFRQTLLLLPKDAVPLSFAFASAYRSTLLKTPSALSDPNAKLKILIEVEKEGLRGGRYQGSGVD
jgi:hypothetical protein